MAKRKIIAVEEDKCNGCGQCIPNCPEGALQVIDGKARLISDLFCDGLGACVGHCPTGAMKVVERDAKPYEEKKVMENIIKAGPNTIKAHLIHLKEHGEFGYLKEALAALKDKGIPAPDLHGSGGGCPSDGGGCPGSRMVSFETEDGGPKTEDRKTGGDETGDTSSQLRQWPIQLHLVSPQAPYYRGKDVVIAADCTAYALGGFHGRILSGRSIAIACPKLDSDQDVYAQKIASLIDDAKVNTLTVVMMEVPCCGGLVHLVKGAASQAKRKVPIKSIIVSIRGEILSEEWEK
ncbi:MAG: 4Fe-4S binding protein [Candidatus Altiarchaeota archaeon]